MPGCTDRGFINASHLEKCGFRLKQNIEHGVVFFRLEYAAPF